MLCFKGNLGSAKDVQLTAQESENNSPPSFTETTQPQHSLAGFHLHPGKRGAEKNLRKISTFPVSQALICLMSTHTGTRQSLSREEKLTGLISLIKKPALTKWVSSNPIPQVPIREKN